MKKKYVPFTTHRLIRRLAMQGLRLLWLLCLVWPFSRASVFAAQHEPLHAASACQEHHPAAGAEKSKESPKPVQLPPLPDGVTELKFNEFFVQPAGNRGLEFSAKLRKLDGQRVRLLGHMVRQDPPPSGSFLLTPIPIELHSHDDHCFIDDLPPSMVQVSAPNLRQEPIAYTPRLLLLTGILSIGNQTEADGRISFVRLALDPLKPAAKQRFSQAAKGAERLLGGPRATRSAQASSGIHTK